MMILVRFVTKYAPYTLPKSQASARKSVCLSCRCGFSNIFFQAAYSCTVLWKKTVMCAEEETRSVKSKRPALLFELGF